jgi:hypothetical protein
MTEEAPATPVAPTPTAPPDPAPMPTGDAFIDNYFNPDLVSADTRTGNQPVETRIANPTTAENQAD